MSATRSVTDFTWLLQACRWRRGQQVGLASQEAIGIGGLPGLRRQAREKEKAELGALEAAQEVQRQQQAALLAEHARTEHNLKELLLACADRPKALERSSHASARSIFHNHVFAAIPTLAAKPAADVTPEEVAKMMRCLLEDGKGRTANKLRSYVRAAHQVAKASRSKPSIPASFRAFLIVGNPTAGTSPDESANRADKRHLTLAELQMYWSILQKDDGIKGIALRLPLLLGGQWIAQLTRRLDELVLQESGTIHDGKGRSGKQPRPHIVSVVKAARRDTDACANNKPCRLSTKGGRTPIVGGNLVQWAVEAVGEMTGTFTKPMPLSDGKSIDPTGKRFAIGMVNIGH